MKINSEIKSIKFKIIYEIKIKLEINKYQIEEQQN